MSAERLQWEIDGADWPHRHASRFVTAAGMRWHVQEIGAGPPLLLVHGTGAGAFSWRAVAELLAPYFRIVIPDLPGHAFSEPLRAAAPSLPGMSHALGELLRELGVAPRLAVGHSAGAAIVIRMALDGLLAPQAIVSMNGALLPPAGLARLVFSPAAKFLSRSSMFAYLAAQRAADRDALRRMLAATGSSVDSQGTELYRRVITSRAHVKGVLDMMANWDVTSIRDEVARLRTPLVLAVGDNDRTVDPNEAYRLKSLLPSARVVTLDGLGHLAHEEAPQRVAEIIQGLAATAHC